MIILYSSQGEKSVSLRKKTEEEAASLKENEYNPEANEADLDQQIKRTQVLLLKIKERLPQIVINEQKIIALLFTEEEREEIKSIAAQVADLAENNPNPTLQKQREMINHELVFLKIFFTRFKRMFLKEDGKSLKTTLSAGDTEFIFNNKETTLFLEHLDYFREKVAKEYERIAKKIDLQGKQTKSEIETGKISQLKQKSNALVKLSAGGTLFEIIGNGIENFKPENEDSRNVAAIVLKWVMLSVLIIWLLFTIFIWCCKTKQKTRQVQDEKEAEEGIEILDEIEQNFLAVKNLSIFGKR